MLVVIVQFPHFNIMGIEHKKTWFYLYQITNLLNGKIYVGVHQTNNMNDGYMGSGKCLRRAYKKYGMSNFSKSILKYTSSEGELLKAEAEVVTTEFVLRKDTYNLTEGGRIFGVTASRKGGRVGGRRTWELKKGVHSPESKKKALIALRERLPILHASHRNSGRLFYDPEFQKEMRRRAGSAESLKKKQETLKKIKHQQGENNNRYGTMWITDGKVSFTIKKGDSIPEGFRKGRVIKKPA